MRQAGARPTWWRQLAAAVVAVPFLVPLVVLVSGALRPSGTPPPSGVELLPGEPTLASVSDAFELVDLGAQLLRSSLVAAVVVPAALVVASWAGLVVAYGSRRVAGLVVAGSLVALMVPTTSLLVGRFAVYDALGWNNTPAALLAPALIAGSPFFVLFFAWAFRRIPRELIDAARLEGAGWLTVWWRVALPSVRPTVAAVAMLTFMVTWSDFLGPLVHLTDADLATVPLGLRSLSELPASEAPVYLAAALVATLPAVAFFLVVQRTLFDLPDRPGAP